MLARLLTFIAIAALIGAGIFSLQDDDRALISPEGVDRLIVFSQTRDVILVDNADYSRDDSQALRGPYRLLAWVLVILISATTVALVAIRLCRHDAPEPHP